MTQIESETDAVADKFERVLYVGANRPEEAKFESVVNREHAWTKPKKGGLWTSPSHPTNGSHWIDWCVSEDFGDGPPFTMWELRPRKVLSIFVVDSYADLEELHRRFGISDRWSEKGIDFEAIGRSFDGLHLTDNGQWATRLSHPLDLYGWDCESTLWFRWVFEQVSGPISFTPTGEADD